MENGLEKGDWGLAGESNLVVAVETLETVAVVADGDEDRHSDYTTDSPQKSSAARAHSARLLAAHDFAPADSAHTHHAAAAVTARSQTSPSASRASSPRCSADAR